MIVLNQWSAINPFDFSDPERPTTSNPLRQRLPYVGEKHDCPQARARNTVDGKGVRGQDRDGSGRPHR